MRPTPWLVYVFVFLHVTVLLSSGFKPVYIGSQPSEPLVPTPVPVPAVIDDPTRKKDDQWHAAAEHFLHFRNKYMRFLVYT